MLRASCLKYNLSPYLQTPNRRSTYKDRLILLKEALFEEQDRWSSLFLTRFDRNKSVAMSIERDERYFLLDSLDWKYLLYEHRSNVNWTVSKLCNCCTHICIRIRQGIWNVPRNVRDDWNREGKARVHVSLEFGYTLLFPGNKIITLLRTTIDLNHCVSKQNVTYTTFCPWFARSYASKPSLNCTWSLSLTILISSFLYVRIRVNTNENF